MRARKRSSTSSSSLALFALGFGLCAIAPKGPFVDEGPPPIKVPQMPWTEFRPPPDDDYYLAYDDFALDHYVLFHGLRGTLPHMKKADVLLAGVSLIPFAFPREVLEKATPRFYAIGLGHAERMEFTRRLIEKHDLRPACVVVNAQYFFDFEMTGFGGDVVNASKWQAMKIVYERTVAGQLPIEHLRIPTAYQPGAWPMLLYRSREYGSWWASSEKPFSHDIPATPDGPIPVVEVPEHRLARARTFRDFLAARGTKLVLTEIPSDPEWLEHRANAHSLAKALDVPFVSPKTDGSLKSRDDEHLNKESALKFAPLFIEALNLQVSCERR